MVVRFFWGLLALLWLNPVAAQSDLQARIENLKLQDAALRAVEESMDQLAGELADVEALAGTMLDDPQGHQGPSESRSQLRAQEAERLTMAFRQQLERFARHVEALPPSWVADTLAAHQQRVEATVTPLLDGPFQQRFTEARELAVGLQADTLEADQRLVPGVAAVQSLSDPDTLSWLDREDLVALVNGPQGTAVVEEIVTAIATDMTLFSENQAVLGGWARQTLASELAALQRQLQQVQSFSGGAEVSREAMQAALEANLGTSPAGVVYPMAQQQAAQRAQFLERQRFAEYVTTQLDPQTDCPALDHTALESLLGEDFRQWPARLEEHLASLQGSFRNTLVGELIGAYQRRPGGEGAEFAARLSTYLASDTPGSVGQVLGAALAECLVPRLSEYREAAALVELQQQHPALLQGSLSLPDEGLAFIAAHSLAELDTLSVPGFPALGDLHLEESQQGFRLLRRGILEEGRFALDTQLNTVTWHQEEFSELVRADPDRQANREQWQQAYEERVYQDWRGFWETQAQDPASPVLSAEKYPRLFAPTRELIAELLPTDWQPEASDTEAEQSPESPPPPEGGCEAVVDTCLQGAVICAEAARACQAGPCEAALASCRGAQERCESASRAFKTQQADALPAEMPLAQFCAVGD